MIAHTTPARLIAVPNPLDITTREFETIGHGIRISDVIERRGWASALVRVNGKPVEQDYVVAPGDAIVMVRVPEAGFVASLLLKVVVVTAVSVGFQLLFPPPKPAQRRDDQASPTYSFDGISSVRSAGTPIPVGYGEIRLGGAVINEYTETVGVPPRTFYRGLIALGEGPFVSIAGLESDTPATQPLVGGEIPLGLEINGNPAQNFGGVRAWVRLGNNEQEAIPGFDEIRSTFSVDVTLESEATTSTSPSGYISTFDETSPFDSTNDAVWTTYGEAYDFDNEADGFVISFRFPRGMVKRNLTTGAREAVAFAFQVRYIALDGGGAPITSGGPNSDGYIRLPIVGPIAFARSSPFQFQYRQDFFAIDSYVPSALGTAALYFGSSGTISHAVGASMPYADDAFVTRLSTSFWVKLAANPSADIVLLSTYDAGGGTNAQGIRVVIERRVSGAVGFGPNPLVYRIGVELGTDDGDTVSTFASTRSVLAGVAEGVFDTAADQWVHVGVSYQTNEPILITINGNAISSTNVFGPSRNDLAWNRAPIVIGDGSTLVTIDDVKVYDATLTLAALRGEYNGGNGTTGAVVPDPTLLVFYNDFEDTGGGEDQSGSGWWATAGSITGDVTTGAAAGIVRESPTSGLERGRYRVEVMRVTQTSTAASVQNEIAFDSIQGIVSERLEYPNTALVGIEIEATEQLNAGIPQLTTTAWQRYGTVWDGVSTIVPSLRRDATKNPAWIALALVLDRRLGLGNLYRATRVDLARWGEWADYCDEVVYDGFRKITVANPSAGDDTDVTYVAATEDPTTGVVRGELLVQVSQQDENSLPAGMIVGKYLRLAGWPDDTEVGVDVDINSPDGEGYEIFEVSLVDGTWSIRCYYDRTDEGAPWTTGNALGADILSDTTALNDATIEGAEPRFECNIVFDAPGKAWESLLEVCATGRAMPVPVGDRLSIRFSAPSDPVGVVTPDNIISGSFEVDYASPNTRPNVYSLNILDESENYERTPVVVPEDELRTAGDQTFVRQENTELRGVTSPGQAERHGRHLLAINRYQIRSGQFDVALDALGYAVGDVLRVSSDVLPRGAASRVAGDSLEQIPGALADPEDLDGAAWTTTAMTVTTGSTASIYGGDAAQTIDGGSAVQALTPSRLGEGWYTVSGFARSVGGADGDTLLVSLAQDRGTPTVTLDLFARTASVTAGDEFETPAVARAQASSGTWMFWSASFFVKRPAANDTPQTLNLSFVPLTDSGAEVSNLLVTQAELPAVDVVTGVVLGLTLEADVTIVGADFPSIHHQDFRGNVTSLAVDTTLTPDGTYTRGDVIFVTTGFRSAPKRGDNVIVSTTSSELLVEIADVSRRPDLSATCRFVEYDSRIFADGLDEGARIETPALAASNIGSGDAGVPISLAVSTNSTLGAAGTAATQIIAAWDVAPSKEDRVVGALVYVRPQSDFPGGWELLGDAGPEAREFIGLLPASLEGTVVQVSVALASRAVPKPLPESGALTSLLVLPSSWQPDAPSALSADYAGFEVTYTATLPSVAPRIAASRVVEFRRGGSSWILSHLIGRTAPGEASLSTTDVFKPTTGTDCATVQARVIYPTGSVSDAVTDTTDPDLPLSNFVASTYQGAATEWETATSTTWFVEPPTSNRPTQTGFAITGGNALEFDTGDTDATFTTNEPGTVGETDADTATLDLSRVPRKLYLGASFEATQAHPSSPSDYGYATGDADDSRWVSEGPLAPLGDEPDNCAVWIEFRLNSSGLAADWSGWRRFRCGIYSAVDVQFRLRATRPSTDFQIAITKFHTRVAVPAADVTEQSQLDLTSRGEII